MRYIAKAGRVVSTVSFRALIVAVNNVSEAVIEPRPCYFAGAWHDTPNYDRDRLGEGARIDGPAIVVQYDTTTVLLPEHWAEVDTHGNLVIWPNDKQA